MNLKNRTAGAVVVVIIAMMVFIRFVVVTVQDAAGEDNVRFGIRQLFELVGGLF
jgi:hypothetical protein